MQPFKVALTETVVTMLNEVVLAAVKERNTASSENANTAQACPAKYWDTSGRNAYKVDGGGYLTGAIIQAAKLATNGVGFTVIVSVAGGPWHPSKNGVCNYTGFVNPIIVSRHCIRRRYTCSG